MELQEWCVMKSVQNSTILGARRTVMDIHEDIKRHVNRVLWNNFSLVGRSVWISVGIYIPSEFHFEFSFVEKGEGYE